jgi:hypothetical protein
MKLITDVTQLVPGKTYVIEYTRLQPLSVDEEDRAKLSRANPSRKFNSPVYKTRFKQLGKFTKIIPVKPTRRKRPDYYNDKKYEWWSEDVKKRKTEEWKSSEKSPAKAQFDNVMFINPQDRIITQWKPKSGNNVVVAIKKREGRSGLPRQRVYEMENDELKKTLEKRAFEKVLTKNRVEDPYMIDNFKAFFGGTRRKTYSKNKKSRRNR